MGGEVVWAVLEVADDDSQNRIIFYLNSTQLLSCQSESN